MVAGYAILEARRDDIRHALLAPGGIIRVGVLIDNDLDEIDAVVKIHACRQTGQVLLVFDVECLIHVAGYWYWSFVISGIVWQADLLVIWRFAYGLDAYVVISWK